LKKKVLIVCHSYPPNPGVGGRRWAIFTKYLLDSDVEVHVLTKQPSSNSVSPWMTYTAGGIMHYYKNNYPSILESNPKTVIEKINYRLALLRLKLLSSSNYYDRGVLSEKLINEKIKETLIQNKIDNLIITGAPFSFLYYGAILNLTEKINFIADIRDSWTSGAYFGFSGLSNNRKRTEYYRLKAVLKKANSVIVPYPEMKENYLELEKSSNIELWPHAVDDEMVVRKEEFQLDSENSIHLVNFGTLYDGLQGTMNSIHKSTMSNDIKIEFYTADSKYKDIFSDNNNVVYNKIIHQKEVFNLLSKPVYALYFTNENIKNYISTKYIETIATRTPIVLVGKDGEVSKFLIDNNLGIFIDESDIEIEFNDLKHRLKKLEYNYNFDYGQYTFRIQTQRLTELLV